MTGFVKIFLASLLLTGYLSAQGIVKIVWEGGAAPAGITLVNRDGARFVQDSLAADSARIISAFQNQGWLDCQLSVSSSIVSGRVVLHYQILKGDRYKLQYSLSTSTPEDSLYAMAVAIIDSHKYQTASLANIEDLVTGLLQLYAQNGYPYCSINPGEYRKGENVVLLITIAIIPGPLVNINRIEFTGLKNIDALFLEKYSGLHPPFGYSTQTLNNTVWRLNHARFLKSAAAPELRYLDVPENGIIYLPVQEVTPVVLDGAAGYSSKDKSLYGKIDGAISNILGGGKQFSFNLSRKDKVSRKIRLAYSEPLFLNLPFGINLETYQTDRDSLYIETGGQAGFTYSSTAYIEYGLAFGISRIAPEPYGRSIMPLKTRRSLTLNFVADRRDYPANPHKGDYFQLEASFVNETTNRDSLFANISQNYRTAKIDYQKSIAIGSTQSIYGRLYARGEFSDTGSVDRQFSVGGFGELRGYNQDMFYVMRAAILTIEYRLLTSREGRAYIFADMGLLQNGLGSNKTVRRAGFGTGIAAPTAGGLAIVELAVPSDEGVSGIKLHFGLRTGF